MNAKVEFLKKVKRARTATVPIPATLETLAEVFQRMDGSDVRAEVPPELYVDMSRQDRWVCTRLPLHMFIQTWSSDAVRLWWIEGERESIRVYGCRLTAPETEEYAILFKVPGIQIDATFRISSTQGIGPFSLRDFDVGQPFIDRLHRQCIVLGTDHDREVVVMLNPLTVKAERQHWPGSLDVYVASIEDALRISKSRKLRRSELAV